ncbi:hypothetical protein [Streptomyces griseofuscus]|uniref:Uncharacterized protein n=1 Tax=Streptomyces griseofuscus TaxID=146922 RepID=A0A3R8WNX2_9ACTN|nr:hypothetical protein [Streptomyces griseofuscus]RRQ81508.1 hypothetical protein CQW44_30370 [Streptomyces griseofuscus]
MSDLTVFDALMRDNRIVLPSVWQAAFTETEEQLTEACPWGVDVLDIARAAWDCLPEAVRGEALDALFYGWWEAEQDRRARAEQAEDDETHPAPCWYPYHKPCTCFDWPEQAGGAL